MEKTKEGVYVKKGYIWDATFGYIKLAPETKPKVKPKKKKKSK